MPVTRVAKESRPSGSLPRSQYGLYDMKTTTPSATIALATLPISAPCQTNQAMAVPATVHAAAPAHPPIPARFSLLQSARNRLSRITTVINFVVTMTGLAICYWTRESWVLSRWTAKKDYLEFCQSQQEKNQTLSQKCNSTLNTTLEDPPLMKRLLPLWLMDTQVQTESQEQREQAAANSWLALVSFSAAVAFILLAMSVITWNRRYQRATLSHSSIIRHCSSLKAKINILLTRLCEVFPRAKPSSTEPCDRHNCLTLEHVCHPLTSEISLARIGSSTTTDSSTLQLPTPSTAVITKTPNSEFRKRVGYRSQDSLTTFRFRAESAGNEGTYEFTGVLDAGAVYSLITKSAARKYGKPLETTEFYFAPNKEPELSYVGQFALPSTQFLRVKPCLLDHSYNNREMELFVVDEKLDTDCILAPEFQTARFCY